MMTVSAWSSAVWPTSTARARVLWVTEAKKRYLQSRAASSRDSPRALRWAWTSAAWEVSDTPSLSHKEAT